MCKFVGWVKKEDIKMLNLNKFSLHLQVFLLIIANKSYNLKFVAFSQLKVLRAA